ncbi:MAG: hypothetical protein CM15mP103_04780 [Gammaproteobacteria bacterium]|nr:MAG: hypothetical protein CM15mP103_04780 [Gammaproteobacteria bacterium]
MTWLVHAGTLCAVLWYFRDTMINLAKSILPRGPRDQSELWALVVATVPVVLAGLLFKDVIATDARAVNVIIVTTLLFGVLLGLADRFSRRGAKHPGPVTLRDALLIGLAQVFALIPGTSRSGVTITAALFLGYHPAAATRFSFLLSVPVIGGAVGADARDHGVRRVIAFRGGRRSSLSRSRRYLLMPRSKPLCIG